jgi:energy-converting hydrogenase Eha subunit C
MTWKSYIIVVVMVTMGTLLRHSAIPKIYLSILYIGIGLSLVLSSIRYLRVLLRQLKKNQK